MKNIEFKNFATKVYFHADTGDFDTYEGWCDATCKEDVDESIDSNGGLDIADDEVVAEAAFNAAVKKDDMEVSYYYVTVDANALCYKTVVDLADISSSHSASDDKVKYMVTIVFSKEQEEYAMNDEGTLDSSDLDWDNPYKVIVEEITQGD